MRRRPQALAVASGAALLAGLLVLGAAASASADSAPPSTIALPGAVLDSLESRLAALEAQLSIPRVGSGHAAHFHQRYAELRRREEVVAAHAAEWLRFVPSEAPVAGGTVTSAYSAARFHPIRRRVLPHVGVDIGAPNGAPVRAAAEGTVYATADHPTYGLTVDVQHGESGFLTRYAHLSRVVVRPGQALARGERIGAVGSTGLSTGPHVHYEVFYRGSRLNPIGFLPAGAVAAHPHRGSGG